MALDATNASVSLVFADGSVAIVAVALDSGAIAWRSALDDAGAQASVAIDQDDGSLVAYTLSDTPIAHAYRNLAGTLALAPLGACAGD